MARLQLHCPGGIEGGADFAHVALAQVVVVVADVVLLACFGDRAQGEITPRRKQGLALCAGVDHLGAVHAQVAAGLGQQRGALITHEQPGHAVDVGPAEVAQSGRVLTAAGGGDHVEITASAGDQHAARIDQAAEVVQVGTRIGADRVTADAAVEVAQVLRVDLHRGAASNGAAVDQIAAQVQLH
ncbi:hypothetical protein D3C71_1475750 [compost metagenome]